jgi:alkylhydroperoxidase family enzyme
VTWLPAAAGGVTPLDRVFGLCPELYADYCTFLSHCWSRSQIDPIVLELCSLRVAHLVGCEADRVVRNRPALDARKLSALSAWPTSPLFTACERACLSFAEQFVMDPHRISDAQAAEVSAHLGPAGLVGLTEVLALFEGFARFRLILGVEADAGAPDRDDAPAV